MLRRLLALPWSDIGWSTLLADLALLVVCPVTLLLFASNPVTGGFLQLASPLLVVALGALGGYLVRSLFERLAPDQGLSMEVRWALALAVGITAGFLAGTLGAFFKSVPVLFKLAESEKLSTFFGQLAALLELSGSFCSPDSLIFPVGAVLGMFWGWWSGRRGVA